MGSFFQNEPKFFDLPFSSLLFPSQSLNSCFPRQIIWVRFAETYIGPPKPPFRSIFAQQIPADSSAILSAVALAKEEAQSATADVSAIALAKVEALLK